MIDNIIISVDPGALVLESIGTMGLPGQDLRRLTYQASTAISALRAVKFDGVDLNYAEADLSGGFVGISLSSGPGLITVVNNDVIEDTSWSWSPGAIFSGPNGILTQSPAQFAKEIARSIGPTKIFVREGPVIKL